MNWPEKVSAAEPEIISVPEPTLSTTAAKLPAVPAKTPAVGPVAEIVPLRRKLPSPVNWIGAEPIESAPVKVERPVVVPAIRAPALLVLKLA